MVKASSKPSKSPASKRSQVTTTKARKPAAAKRAKKVVSNKVDYYPNRMTYAVSALAGTLLVLMAVITVTGAGL